MCPQILRYIGERVCLFTLTHASIVLTVLINHFYYLLMNSSHSHGISLTRFLSIVFFENRPALFVPPVHTFVNSSPSPSTLWLNMGSREIDKPGDIIFQREYSVAFSRPFEYSSVRLVTTRNHDA